MYKETVNSIKIILAKITNVHNRKSPDCARIIDFSTIGAYHKFANYLLTVTLYLPSATLPMLMV